MSRSLFYIFAVVLLAACSSDPAPGGGDIDVGTDMPVRDLPAFDTDALDEPDESADLDSDTGDDAEIDTQDDVAIDLVEDEGSDGPPACTTDFDNDGYYDHQCGGDDCDDREYRANPGLRESCDFIDNDCDNVLNNEIECVFYAHTYEGLYELDPFKNTIERIIDADNMWDMDTHPSGGLYAVNEDALFLLDPTQTIWFRVGDLDHSGGDANGMAIDLDGIAYLTAGNYLYTINLGTARTTYVGELGGDFESSGDCVVNKDNTLFMSSRHLEDTNSLISIDGATGAGTDIGPIGFGGVYGLTAAWGHLFGLNSYGELISIDPTTGAGELLHTFEGYSWWGAASTPGR